MATSNGANPSRPFEEVRIDVPGDRPNKTIVIGKNNKSICGVVLVVASIIGLIIYFDSQENFPRFQLDQVSVSVKNATNTAVWYIGFSTDRPAGHLGVWARFMSRDYKVESPGKAAGNWTVSVSTLLPTSFPGGLTLEQVVFKCNDYQDSIHRYVVEAVCKDVTVVRINETTADIDQWAIMKGGPRFCPLVYHDRIDITRGGRH